MKIIQETKSLQIPIYGGRIDIVISNEDDVRNAAARNFNVHEDSLRGNDAVCLGRSNNAMRIYPVLFSRNISPGMIAHESKHLVNAIFLDIGAHLDMKNDEHECYLLMWIVNRIWEVKTKFENKVKTHESKSRINADKAQNESCVNGVRNPSTKHRTKAVSMESGIPLSVKVVPAQLLRLVKRLGYIDIRDKKHLTLSSEERLLLYLMPIAEKLRQNYKGFDVDEIQLEAKAEIHYRGEDSPVYAVRIKDATEIAIPYSQWKKLNLPKIIINKC